MEAQKKHSVQSVPKVSPQYQIKVGFFSKYTNWNIVAEALVRYINQGITLGSVNLPEAQLRSLTLDEPEHARVSCSLFAMPFRSNF